MRSRGGRLVGSLGLPSIKKMAVNSWAAIHDTYLSTKDTFEHHKVVFTVGTSVASVATAWGGYTLRHHHETKIEHRLESIEKAIQTNTELEHSELKKLVDPGSSRVSALFATAATTFVLGYGLGWKGGRWYANRKFRKEQMKMLGQINPNRWQLLGNMKTNGLQFQSFKRKLARYRALKTSNKTLEKMPKDVAGTDNIRTEV